MLTFLFTDIEGSTAKWENHPVDMGIALQRHDQMIAILIESENGEVFKSLGDGVCSVFSEPGDAVTAALFLRDQIRKETWPVSIAPFQVRIGIHSGLAEKRSGDYFGQTLNRTARLMSSGHGDQILLSEATRRLLPMEVDNIHLLGHYRLRDLLLPEKIYQVGEESESHGPLRVLDEKRHNLPIQATSFVGRRSELSGLVNRIRANRLVTITGPGGTGKTRLALQAAAELVDEFESASFVELGGITQERGVAPAIADAIGFRNPGSHPISDALVDHLLSHSDLLVLDNFEHVIGESMLLSRLLQASPRLHIVVTSRELLRLQAEHQFLLEPLDIPVVESSITIDNVLNNEAVRLFEERTRAVRPEFRVNNSNMMDVIAICSRLDGLPLAIELAAARIRLFGVSHVRAQLESGSSDLGTGPVDVPARQYTLTDTIAWSYDLLNEGEQILFRRLAVFTGGRSLEAIQEVCLHEIDLDGLKAIESLADKNLIRIREGRAGEPRLDLLETLYRFAREKLLESSEFDELQKRHARFFSELVESAESELRGAGQAKWIRRLEDEISNIDAAIRWSFDSSEIECGLRIVAGLRDFWFYQSHIQDMGYYTTRALEYIGDVDTALRAGVLMTAGFYANSQHDRNAIDLLDQATELFKRAGDSHHQALAQVWAAGSRELHDNDLDVARKGILQGLELARGVGANAVVAQALNYLGELERCLGNYEHARNVQEEGLELSRQTGEVRRVAMMTHNLGWIAYHLGDDALSEQLMRETMELSIEFEFYTLFLESMFGLAQQMANKNQLTDSTHLIAFAEHEFDRIGRRPQRADAEDHARVKQFVLENLGEDKFNEEIKYGVSLDLEQVIALVRQMQKE